MCPLTITLYKVAAAFTPPTTAAANITKKLNPVSPVPSLVPKPPQVADATPDTAAAAKQQEPFADIPGMPDWSEPAKQQSPLADVPGFFDWPVPKTPPAAPTPQIETPVQVASPVPEEAPNLDNPGLSPIGVGAGWDTPDPAGAPGNTPAPPPQSSGLFDDSWGGVATADTDAPPAQLAPQEFMSQGGVVDDGPMFNPGALPAAPAPAAAVPPTQAPEPAPAAAVPPTQAPEPAPAAAVPPTQAPEPPPVQPTPQVPAPPVQQPQAPATQPESGPMYNPSGEAPPAAGPPPGQELIGFTGSTPKYAPIEPAYTPPPTTAPVATPFHSNSAQRHADAYNTYHAGGSTDGERDSALGVMDSAYASAKEEQDRYFKAVDSPAMRHLQLNKPELYNRYVEHFKKLYGGPAAIDINFSARGGRPLTTSAPVTNKNYRVGDVGPSGGRVVGVRPA